MVKDYNAFFEARENNAVYAFLGLTAPPGSKFCKINLPLFPRPLASSNLTEFWFGYILGIGLEAKITLSSYLNDSGIQIPG
ncbi:hypothetical protein HGM15179_020965 [Zosterops borbonicus]|uniref:Uncharacterized protein n=1 Tax=Zosterops borbonicus TaxID=364589 RepID=A0A8K1FY86_9PASS|nr:hypothetical protein HGM15179_020965 [Zosterops borbonicus]